MRSCCLVAAAMLAWAGAAAAGPLATATWLTQIAPFTASPGIVAEGLVGPNPNAPFGCACVSLTLPAFELTQIDSSGLIAVYYRLTLGGSQHLTGTRSRIHATQGVPGEFLMKVAEHVREGTQASKFQPGPTTLVRVPLSVGVKRTRMGTFTLLESPHRYTVFDYGWTAGRVSLADLTSRGAALPDLTAEGSFFATADAQPWKINLVAPTRIHLSGNILQRRTAGFTRLRVGFAEDAWVPYCVPEPSTALLLAAGFVGLALSAPRRRAA